MGDGVLKAEQVGVWHDVAGEGHEAGAGERLKAVVVADRRRLSVAVGATHEGADAVAARRILGVGAAGDLLDLLRQLTLRVDAVVEVQRRDAELWHERQPDASEATLGGSVACCGEGGHAATVVDATLLAVTLTAVGVVGHLQRLAGGVVRVLLKAPHQPAL